MVIMNYLIKTGALLLFMILSIIISGCQSTSFSHTEDVTSSSRGIDLNDTKERIKSGLQGKGTIVEEDRDH